MAARRVRTFGENQMSLKNGFINTTIFAPWQRVLPVLAHKAPAYSIDCHAIHDADNAVLRVKAGLIKNQNEPIQAANCQFVVYAIDKSDMTETLVFAPSVVSYPDSTGYFHMTVTEANVASEFIGEVDYVLMVQIERFAKAYKRKFYFNALGIFDFALRLKKKVNFIEINKKDVGT